MNVEEIDALILGKWAEYTNSDYMEGFTNNFSAEEIIAIENWLENHKKEGFRTHRNDKGISQEEHSHYVVMDYVRQWIIDICLSDDTDRLKELAAVLSEDC